MEESAVRIICRSTVSVVTHNTRVLYVINVSVQSTQYADANFSERPGNILLSVLF